jgi:cobalt-zinc-cadmium efflux system membrane fusion protein
MTRYRIALLAALSLGCGGAVDQPPVAKDLAAATDVVHLSASQLSNAGLAFATVEARRDIGTLEATAQIEPAADRVAKIASRVPGRIVAVHVSAGDRVARGQSVAELDSPEVGQAKADYLSARATATLARAAATRERQLFERHVSAEREWREAEAEATRAEAAEDAAENRLHALGLEDSELEGLRTERHYSATMTMRSPVAGVVAERNAAVGQIVEPMNAFLTVMDLREVWTLVDVYEQNLSQVRVGQSVDVTTTAYPDDAFSGTVASIGALIEPQSRSVKVRVVLPNPRERLKPGMFATVRFRGTIHTATTRLYVPASAVQRDGQRTIVFVPGEGGAFRAISIRVGQETSEWVQVLDGLTVGERVVSRGAFLLKSELRKGNLGEGGE